MRDINIKTTLGVRPPRRPHEILVITRGATASINHDLYNKVYTLDYIDQITFVFRQEKKKWMYEMIEYFKEAAGVALTDTIYYEKVEVNIPSASQYKFVVKEIPVGQSVVGYYVKYDLPDGVVTDNWQFNDHFSYEAGKEYAYVNFMLDNNETLQFKPTTPDNNVQFEIVTRFNTDYMNSMHTKDSVVIDRQHDIAVVGSLYAGDYQSSGSTGGAVCSDDLVCE